MPTITGELWLIISTLESADGSIRRHEAFDQEGFLAGMSGVRHLL